MEITALVGKIIEEILINSDNDEMKFICTDGTKYLMYHDQDCCESVEINEIFGDLDDLKGEPIVMAEESSNSGDNNWGSETWTFYKLATAKGFVTIRWFGESNGYYSEEVSFKEVK